MWKVASFLATQAFQSFQRIWKATSWSRLASYQIFSREGLTTLSTIIRRTWPGKSVA